MTLSNDEINAKIAVIKGYTRAPLAYFDLDKKEFVPESELDNINGFVEVQHWLDPVTHRTGALPDWAGSLDMAVELMDKGGRIEFHANKTVSAWLWNGEIYFYTSDYPGNDKSPSRAVCLAWLKSQGVKLEVTE